MDRNTETRMMQLTDVERVALGHPNTNIPSEIPFDDAALVVLYAVGRRDVIEGLNPAEWPAGARRNAQLYKYTSLSTALEGVIASAQIIAGEVHGGTIVSGFEQLLSKEPPTE